MCCGIYLFLPSPLGQWYAFREVYMSRIDKTEDNVQRMFREYQDHWTRYAEGLERGEGSVKVSGL